MSPRKLKLPPGVYWDARAGTYKLDLRKQPLPRLHISLDVKDVRDAELATQRASAVRTLYDRADYAPIGRLRSGELSIAEIGAAVREGDFERLRRLSDKNITIATAIERHLDALREDRSPGTMRSYDSIGASLLAKFGNIPLADITPDQCREWLNEAKVSRKGKRVRKWATNTRAAAYTLSKTIWTRAISEEAEHAEKTKTRALLTHNPWDKVERPASGSHRIVYLSGEEWARLRFASQGTVIGTVVALCCLAGLRRNEAGQLRAAVDVDMDNRLLRIQARTGRYAWKPKRPRSVRIVPMGEELHRILTDHYAAGYADGVYLIHPPGKDQPFHPQRLTAMAKPVFIAAGLKWGYAGDGLVLHSLRHTFATRLLLGRPPDVLPVPVHVVAKLLGDRPEQVLSTYAHILPESLEEAVKSMDDFARFVA